MCRQRITGNQEVTQTENGSDLLKNAPPFFCTHARRIPAGLFLPRNPTSKLLKCTRVRCFVASFSGKFRYPAQLSRRHGVSSSILDTAHNSLIINIILFQFPAHCDFSVHGAGYETRTRVLCLLLLPTAHRIKTTSHRTKYQQVTERKICKSPNKIPTKHRFLLDFCKGWDYILFGK